MEQGLSDENLNSRNNFGGITSYHLEGTVNNTETWNGTSWTEVNNMLMQESWSWSKLYLSFGSGGSSAGDGESNKTETWNGSAWSEVADLISMSRGRYCRNREAKKEIMLVVEETTRHKFD